MYAAMPNPQIDKYQLQQLTKAVGRCCQIDDQKSGQHEAIFAGQFNLIKLRNGLTLHSTDGCDIGNFNTQTTIKPRIGFMLFLEGQCNVHYGEREVKLGIQHQQQKRVVPEATLISVTRPETFTRQGEKGRHLKKIVIGIDSDWLESIELEGFDDYQQIISFSKQHLKVQRYLASKQMQILAEKLFNRPTYSPFLQKMYLEGLTLELATEALTLLIHSSSIIDTSVKLQPYEIKRVNKVLELLRSVTDFHAISLDYIANELGTNINTLQRNFRTMMGTTIFEYYRCQKLMEARSALENNSVNVLGAALLAGYNSAANFSTAFRRQFGVSPNQVRGKLFPTA